MSSGSYYTLKKRYEGEIDEERRNILGQLTIN